LRPLLEEVDRVPEGHQEGLAQVLVDAQDVPVGGRLGDRPLVANAFVESDGYARLLHRALDCRQIHLTVTLQDVSVAGKDQSARLPDGDVQGGAFVEIAKVQVASVLARRH